MKKINKIIIILTTVVISLLIVLSIVIIRKNKKENLLPDSISSITIEYYQGYNISSAEALNSLHDYNYIEKQIIQLTEEEINNIKKEFSNIYDDTEEFSKCKCVISDDYKMIKTFNISDFEGCKNFYIKIFDEHGLPIISDITSFIFDKKSNGTVKITPNNFTKFDLLIDVFPRNILILIIRS